VSENQAQAINVVVGVPVSLACVWLLGQLGVQDNVLLVAAMLAIVVPSFMVGVIGLHYRHKRETQGDDPDPQ
jgi:ABC-type dipeptide/oligopeptide/nickel transport system permease component